MNSGPKSGKQQSFQEYNEELTRLVMEGLSRSPLPPKKTTASGERSIMLQRIIAQSEASAKQREAMGQVVGSSSETEAEEWQRKAEAGWVHERRFL